MGTVIEVSDRFKMDSKENALGDAEDGSQDLVNPIGLKLMAWVTLIPGLSILMIHSPPESVADRIYLFMGILLVATGFNYSFRAWRAIQDHQSSFFTWLLSPSQWFAGI